MQAIKVYGISECIQAKTLTECEQFRIQYLELFNVVSYCSILIINRDDNTPVVSHNNKNQFRYVLYHAQHSNHNDRNNHNDHNLFNDDTNTTRLQHHQPQKQPLQYQFLQQQQLQQPSQNWQRRNQRFINRLCCCLKCCQHGENFPTKMASTLSTNCNKTNNNFPFMAPSDDHEITLFLSCNDNNINTSINKNIKNNFNNCNSNNVADDTTPREISFQHFTVDNDDDSYCQGHSEDGGHDYDAGRNLMGLRSFRGGYQKCEMCSTETNEQRGNILICNKYKINCGECQAFCNNNNNNNNNDDISICNKNNCNDSNIDDNDVICNNKRSIISSFKPGTAKSDCSLNETNINNFCSSTCIRCKHENYKHNIVDNNVDNIEECKDIVLRNTNCLPEILYDHNKHLKSLQRDKIINTFNSPSNVCNNNITNNNSNSINNNNISNFNAINISSNITCSSSPFSSNSNSGCSSCCYICSHAYTTPSITATTLTTTNKIFSNVIKINIANNVCTSKNNTIENGIPMNNDNIRNMNIYSLTNKTISSPSSQTTTTTTTFSSEPLHLLTSPLPTRHPSNPTDPGNVEMCCYSKFDIGSRYSNRLDTTTGSLVSRYLDDSTGALEFQDVNAVCQCADDDKADDDSVGDDGDDDRAKSNENVDNGIKNGFRINRKKAEQKPKSSKNIVTTSSSNNKSNNSSDHTSHSSKIRFKTLLESFTSRFTKFHKSPSIDTFNKFIRRDDDLAESSTILQNPQTSGECCKNKNVECGRRCGGSCSSGRAGSSRYSSLKMRSDYAPLCEACFVKNYDAFQFDEVSKGKIKTGV
ncbi:hypothetical protein HELRODRAFT_162112 [Helobdella robusta]|uniref:Uncharacterized protein n=1 Tax=Helobdella robusta TaxID=6412 RepID=T1ES89_HELRO|nr:hypothetical protein HELRODRAFT_162112 [Helobdella robusta]ESN98663.1 hypothetical protein HELRODRAFT_162112 [Helobdella robusta]